MRTCAIPGCSSKHGEKQVMCRFHWFKVSKETRDFVWNEYRTAPKSPEHFEAITRAFEEAMAAEEAPA